MLRSTASSFDALFTALPDSGRIIPVSCSKDVLSHAVERSGEESRLRQAREQYLQQITKLHSEARRSGYEEGLALAAQRTVRTLHMEQNVYRDAEQNMVKLVLTALEKIMGELPAEVVTPTIVLKAIRELREKAGHITVIVHPEMVGVVSGQLETWNRESATALTLHVVGDEAFGLLDSRLDCGDNVIDTGLSIQLAAVRRVLNEIVAQSDVDNA